MEKIVKKRLFVGSLVVLLIILIIIFIVVYQKAKAYKIDEFFYNDDPIVTIDDEVINTSQFEIFKLIKCYEVIFNDKTSEANSYLADDKILNELINIYVVSKQCEADNNKITPEEKQSDLRKNLKIIAYGIPFTDDDVYNTSNNILTFLKTKAKNYDENKIADIVEILKYVDNENFVKIMNDVTKKYMVYNEYFSEYSDYMARQSYSKFEINQIFNNKHIIDVLGNYVITKK